MIVVICGPAGAGKTTTVSCVRDRLESQGQDVQITRSDDFSRQTYEQLYGVVASSKGGIHLVDGTFYKREWQTTFRTLSNARFVHVTASLETCLERNRARRDSIDEQGVYVIHREFADPDADLVVDTDELRLEESVDRIVAGIDSWQRVSCADQTR